MNMSNSIRRLFTALGFGLGTVALVVVAFGLFAATASASSAPVGKAGLVYAPVTVTGTPSATRTPRPIKLRPWVQFGHARPGGEAHYRQLLFNHLSEPSEVNLDGNSVSGWDVTVNPSTTTALPNYANIITVTVSVPENPAHRVDIERTRAVLSSTEPFTTHAFLITITRRHIFTDVADGHWADDPIQYLVDQGVVSGYSDGSFRPNDNVTRAQFAKMIVTAMGWPVQTPGTPTFADVLADSWAYGYVETAFAHGVISGYSDGTFRPGSDVTRAQLAKMVYTARGWTLDTPTITNFNDLRPGDWAYSYVQAVSSADVMGGYADRTFRPGAPATRAQIAKILALCLFSDPNN